MSSLALTPPYQIVDREVEVVFTFDQVGANFIRVWCIAAPDGSELDGELQKRAAAASPTAGARVRVEVFTGDAGPKHPWKKTFDKGGKYTFVAQEYQKGSGFRGGYQNDPRGAREESKLGTETTLTIYIGERVEQKVGVGADFATLVLYMWDDSCRATDLKTYGIVTPTIINKRATSRAKLAIASVIGPEPAISWGNRLGALVNIEASTIIGDLTTIVGAIVSKWNDHMADASAHARADTENTLPLEFESEISAKDLPTVVNRLLQVVRRHYSNDSGSGVGSNTGLHPGGADWVRMPLYNAVSTLEEAYGAVADLIRSIAPHVPDISLHTDITWSTLVESIPPLMYVHHDYLAALAPLEPGSPVAAPSGSTLLVSKAGGKLA